MKRLFAKKAPPQVVEGGTRDIREIKTSSDKPTLSHAWAEGGGSPFGSSAGDGVADSLAGLAISGNGGSGGGGRKRPLSSSHSSHMPPHPFTAQLQAHAAAGGSFSPEPTISPPQPSQAQAPQGQAPLTAIQNAAVADALAAATYGQAQPGASPSSGGGGGGGGGGSGGGSGGSGSGRATSPFAHLPSAPNGRSLSSASHHRMTSASADAGKVVHIPPPPQSSSREMAAPGVGAYPTSTPPVAPSARQHAAHVLAVSSVHQQQQPYMAGNSSPPTGLARKACAPVLTMAPQGAAPMPAGAVPGPGGGQTVSYPSPLTSFLAVSSPSSAYNTSLLDSPPKTTTTPMSTSNGPAPGPGPSAARIPPPPLTPRRADTGGSALSELEMPHPPFIVEAQQGQMQQRQQQQQHIRQRSTSQTKSDIMHGLVSGSGNGSASGTSGGPADAYAYARAAQGGREGSLPATPTMQSWPAPAAGVRRYNEDGTAASSSTGHSYVPRQSVESSREREASASAVAGSYTHVRRGSSRPGSRGGGGGVGLVHQTPQDSLRNQKSLALGSGVGSGSGHEAYPSNGEYVIDPNSKDRSSPTFFGGIRPRHSSGNLAAQASGVGHSNDAASLASISKGSKEIKESTGWFGRFKGSNKSHQANQEPERAPAPDPGFETSNSAQAVRDTYIRQQNGGAIPHATSMSSMQAKRHSSLGQAGAEKLKENTEHSVAPKRSLFGTMVDPHRSSGGKENEKQKEKEKDSGKLKEKDKDGGKQKDAYITKKIGWLCAYDGSPSDWAYILSVADKLSHSESASKEASRALRKEFKYALPDAQKRAARIWAILALNSSDRFRLQIATKRFLDVVEDTIKSKSTPPFVKQSLLNVLSGLAYEFRKDSELSAITKLWNKIKPAGAPVDGTPIDPQSDEFRPPDSRSRGRRKNSATPRIILKEVDIRKLHEECAIARTNAQNLVASLAAEGLQNPALIEMETKVNLSQDFILAQIPWASAEAGNAREAAKQLRAKGSDQAGEPGATPEEKLLADLLNANEHLNKASSLLRVQRKGAAAADASADADRSLAMGQQASYDDDWAERMTQEDVAPADPFSQEASTLEDYPASSPSASQYHDSFRPDTDAVDGEPAKRWSPSSLDPRALTPEAVSETHLDACTEHRTIEPGSGYATADIHRPDRLAELSSLEGMYTQNEAGGNSIAALMNPGHAPAHAYRGGPRPFPGSSSFAPQQSSPGLVTTHPQGSASPASQVGLQCSEGQPVLSADDNVTPASAPYHIAGAILPPLQTNIDSHAPIIDSPASDASSSIIESPVVPSAKALGKRRAISVREPSIVGSRSATPDVPAVPDIPALPAGASAPAMTYEEEAAGSYDTTYMDFLRSRPMPPMPPPVFN